MKSGNCRLNWDATCLVIRKVYIRTKDYALVTNGSIIYSPIPLAEFIPNKLDRLQSLLVS